MNAVTIIGRLGGDPETRFSSQGAEITCFSIAYNDRYKDDQGNQQEYLSWFNCFAYGKVGEVAGTYLHKKPWVRSGGGRVHITNPPSQVEIVTKGHATSPNQALSRCVTISSARTSTFVCFSQRCRSLV